MVSPDPTGQYWGDIGKNWGLLKNPTLHKNVAVNKTAFYEVQPAADKTNLPDSIAVANIKNVDGTDITTPGYTANTM